MQDKQPHKSKLWYVTLAIAALLVIAVMIGYLKYGIVIFLIPIFLSLTTNIASLTGMNEWLARSLAAFLVVPLWFGSRYLLTHFFSRDTQRKILGSFGFFALIGLSCLAIYLSSRETFFDNKSGKALQYYAIVDGQYIFSNKPGFEPRYGNELRAVTPTVMKDYFAKSSYVPERVSSKEEMLKKKFLDPSMLGISSPVIICFALMILIIMGVGIVTLALVIQVQASKTESGTIYKISNKVAIPIVNPDERPKEKLNLGFDDFFRQEVTRRDSQKVTDPEHKMEITDPDLEIPAFLRTRTRK